MTKNKADLIKEYLSKLFNSYKKGDAREESYYEHLSNLLKEYSETKRNKKIDITILPKKTEAGNPDFRVWDGRQKIVGYIEAKDLGVDLDKVEDSEQMERYNSTFPNVILTNFTEFRLYRDGELIDKVSVARPFIFSKLGTIPPAENEDKLFRLFERFLSFSLPKTYTAKTLAIELAKRTRFLKDEIVTEELKTGTESIQGFFNAFKEFLIAGLTEEEFADLYSQTITYGLFAARLRAGEEFNRKIAFTYIPKTIGILRDIFKFISVEDPPESMQIIIDDIAEVLAVADAMKILDKYFKEGKGSDPVLHFYETFLEVYDPETREKRGVYYTPEPVVSFIVRSLHQILKDKFGLADGLASKNVTLLDPAGGTLSFPAKAIQVAVEEFEGKYGKGAVKSFLKDQVLENYYAFELMMAPYAIGHMKMSFLLEELGYRLDDNDRVKYYLTNTLEMKELEEAKFPGMSSLSHESHEAGKVKKQVPILVILGNPPYSGHSSNIGEWISLEIKEYYKVDGKPLGEKNPKWLQDDYVKFIRFAQWKIDEAGEGVLGFITNHSYLDNPTFRGMRQSLMDSFDEIYILDLHGNSKKKEKSPDGSKDENVFDIQQGVATAFLIKRKSVNQRFIFHQDLYGLRENKYEWLNKNNINSIVWNKLNPQSEHYLFIPKSEELWKEYEIFQKITEIFPLNGVGMTTARDEFVIDFERSKLINRIRLFKNSKLKDNELHSTFRIRKKKGWDIRKAWRMLQDLTDDEINSLTVDVAYRPFDNRKIFYHDSLVWRTVKRLMPNMLSENKGILFTRPQSPKYTFSTLVTDSINDQCVVGNKSAGAGVSYLAPLYQYPEADKKDLFSEHEAGEKKPNIKPEIFEQLKSSFKKEVTPEEIFYYIYAVLYSNTYRTKYAEFLKIDFPRIPFTKGYKLFIQLGKLGKQLADLHLLKSKELEKPIAKFPVGGDNKVENLEVHTAMVDPQPGKFLKFYKYNRVYINKKQYFEPVPVEVWDYQIGGYKVCEKWLKDRKGRTLSLDEITTYCKIVTALEKTIEIQKQIEEMYEGVEG